MDWTKSCKVALPARCYATEWRLHAERCNFSSGPLLVIEAYDFLARTQRRGPARFAGSLDTKGTAGYLSSKYLLGVIEIMSSSNGKPAGAVKIRTPYQAPVFTVLGHHSETRNLAKATPDGGGKGMGS